ncbi:MAG: hypothetical protein R3E47_02295 [Paracoccaceae bacterium]
MKDLKPAEAAQLPAEKARNPAKLSLDGKGDILSIAASGDLGALAEAAGNASVLSGIFAQMASLGSYGHRFDEAASNFALGFVDSMQPRDAAELALLSQMAATHQAVMMFARRLNHVENIPQQDAAERAFNKLVRSYAAQMEALKRYRSKGQQVVRVERVTVADGGQAIVGNVNQRGAGDD